MHKGVKERKKDWLLVILFINDERSNEKKKREKQGKKIKWSDINEEVGEGLPSS